MNGCCEARQGYGYNKALCKLLASYGIQTLEKGLNCLWVLLVNMEKKEVVDGQTNRMGDLCVPMGGFLAQTNSPENSFRVTRLTKRLVWKSDILHGNPLLDVRSGSDYGTQQPTQLHGWNIMWLVGVIYYQ